VGEKEHEEFVNTFHKILSSMFLGYTEGTKVQISLIFFSWRRKI
jgi:hypothetical protein